MLEVESHKKDESQLEEDVAAFYDDPLGYVLYALPWGEPGVLKDEYPDTWQVDTLTDLGNEIKKRNNSLDLQAAIQIAVASGHGIGKTALISWIILWFISTRPHPQIVVTANTKNQLLKKTWRELAKWQKHAINGHWFDWSQTAFTLKKAQDTWFASAVPWSENNSEAFAGTHEEYVLVIYDEASAIADVIWEGTEGAMTTPGAIWIAFGNPTKNTGRFRECFRKFKKRWITKQVDSRSAKKASKAQIAQWLEDYGEESDFFKVRVRGVFPDAADNQFFPTNVVERCMNLRLPEESYNRFPIIVSVDVARFGDDQSVITVRQQRKIHAIYKYRKLDLTQLRDKTIGHFREWNGDKIFTDDTGVGGGLTDMLRELNLPVIGVIVGGAADDKIMYFNKRAECLGLLREAMKRGMEIPNDPELETQATGIEYGFAQGGAIQIEKKEDMKKRGLDSPDILDSIALGFAFPVTKQKNSSKFSKADVNKPQDNVPVSTPTGGTRFRKQGESELKTNNRRRRVRHGQVSR